MNEHLSKANKSTLDDLNKIQNYIELDWTGFDNNLIKTSNSLPIVSCGYVGCSAIILFSENKIVSLAHMLTITHKNQVNEYLDDMIKEIKKLSNSINEIKAVIIGGKGVKESLEVCKTYNIEVLNTFEFSNEAHRDILVFPQTYEFKLYLPDSTYSWNIKQPSKLKKLN